MTNVVQLPRPKPLRTASDPLAFFVRVGRNDHKELLELLAAGEQGVFGVVIEAPYAERQKELIIEALNRNLDVVLDPKTHQSVLPGSFGSALQTLPWINSRAPLSLPDYQGETGLKRISALVEFAEKHQFTQILGPTHLLNDPNDPWFRTDINLMRSLAKRISEGKKRIGIIYPLALPIKFFRDDDRRAALVAGIRDIPCDSIWLKTENFGDDATGEKAVAFIKACRDLHGLRMPIVADHVGGLPGLGALAFGAVGGIAHGVTINQNFKAAAWRRPAMPGGGGSERRIYLPQLDMLVAPETAQSFLVSSPRVRGRHVCRDPRCCPRGLSDMLQRPARHALFQRAREIDQISQTPPSMRAATFLDRIRSVSDDVASSATFEKVAPAFREKLREKQKALGHLREALAHLAKTSDVSSAATPPARRSSDNANP